MNQALKVGVGVAGGYVLGRTHKLRYAIGLGAWLLGARVPLRPGELVAVAADHLQDNEQVAALVDEVRDSLLGAGRRALSDAAFGQLDQLSDRLHERTHALRDGAQGGGRRDSDREAYPEESGSAADSAADSRDEDEDIDDDFVDRSDDDDVDVDEEFDEEPEPRPSTRRRSPARR